MTKELVKSQLSRIKKALLPSLRWIALVALFACAGFAQDTPTSQTGQPVTHPAVHGHRPTIRDTATPNASLCAECVRDNLRYLAGPMVHGRGSGTEDEHHAAEFIADKLKSYGLAPAAGDGQYLQVGTLSTREVIGNPTLTVEPRPGTNSQPVVFTHGKQIVISGLSQAPVTAPLHKIDLTSDGAAISEIQSGAAFLVKVKPDISRGEASKLFESYRNSQAAIVVLPASTFAQRDFDRSGSHPPRLPELAGNEEPKQSVLFVFAKQDALDQLWAEPNGSTVTLQADISQKTGNTWNVLAKIDGTTEKEQIILLSAHLDHLGVKNGQTYPGADDDASGTTAVMELARVLAKERQPKRTIIVALWGSEEKGLIGARYFLQNPTFPLHNIVANLEFEMIGRPDPKVKPDELWLTGWERTNLGPALAEHGAKLVGDPHPDQTFFVRSDNYGLAEKGIVAQTVSSFGLHPDYHMPSDTVDKIDFQHMDRAIESMLGPVTWLANTDFKPQWVEGKKP